MTSILLEPHHDDATLFAAFTCIRERPLVVTVFRSVVQERFGITHEQRARENATAISTLGCMWDQWDFPDSDPHVASIRAALGLLDARSSEAHVFAPAVEVDGHAQHNLIGQLADEVFGEDRVTHYLTYGRHRGKSRDGSEVPFEPAWIRTKLRALACYESQIDTPAANCWMWFAEDLREYVQP